MCYVSVVTLDDVVERLRAVLAGRAEVRFALLFGSAVTRGLDGARDLDVAVSLSAPVSLFEIARLAGELEGATGREVDVADLGSASTLLRWEVLTTGRVIAAADAGALADFRARVPIEWAELVPHRERQAEGLRKVLGG